ncbi:MAG: TIM barrel protein [Armatimonadota bacterium]|nr:TIM barrel protein [Armatimonadota bacterium]MDR7449351.1 TIM barrel protein [Armatimonadota bacterium]MDR7458363.1 TIM barrel protein [Armatimonadota bacterium]MDR7478832.1 TIM barrel protein [Armatimonadota bacterium]MDR7488718.1 TIM barrel protein [Armatimonadota bacterium]
MPLRDLRPQRTRRSPEELLRHLRTFELVPRFSVGVWYFSPMASRFHEPYGPAVDLPARLERVAALRDYGVEAVEAHYPNEISEATLDLWRQFTRDTGIRLLTIVPGLFADREFEFGSLSSPLPEARERALQRTIAALRLNRELDTDFAIVWPGIDGYENPFGVDLAAMRERFAEGLAEAMDAVPGVRIAFEPKPYEPRGRILYGSTAEGLLLAARVEERLRAPENRRLLAEGHALLALNPETGHMLMGYEDLPYAFSLVCEYGRLAHSHWNSQPLGNYDQDLDVGVVAPEQLEAALYVLKLHGYREHFGIDVNPERLPPETAVRNSIDAIRAAADRVNGLDHEQVLWAVTHPDRARGWLEAYLIRVRASRPERLPPLPPLPR